jgi:hypothetical protein
MSYQLSLNELTHIQNLKDSGQYHVAYQYIAEIDALMFSNPTSIDGMELSAYQPNKKEGKTI